MAKLKPRYFVEEADSEEYRARDESGSGAFRDGSRGEVQGRVAGGVGAVLVGEERLHEGVCLWLPAEDAGHVGPRRRELVDPIATPLRIDLAHDGDTNSRSASKWTAMSASPACLIKTPSCAR